MLFFSGGFEEAAVSSEFECVQGRLSGLCGNFDLKTVNEMRTPENMDSPTPQEFGNSWTATEASKAELSSE